MHACMQASQQASQQASKQASKQAIKHEFAHVGTPSEFSRYRAQNGGLVYIVVFCRKRSQSAKPVFSESGAPLRRENSCADV